MYLFKNKIIFNSVKFVATKRDKTTQLFPLPSFVALIKLGIREPRSEIRDNHPGSATLPVREVYDFGKDLSNRFHFSHKSDIFEIRRLRF
jgi:hypothetical protein